MSLFTVAMIKSPTFRRGQSLEIIERITLDGRLWINALEHKRLCDTTIKAFYHGHVDRPYFQDLADSVSDGVVAILLEASRGVDAIATWREMIGATKSSTAAAGTIRADFGGHRYRGACAPTADNAVHGSDSPRAAEYEYGVLFDQKKWGAVASRSRG